MELINQIIDFALELVAVLEKFFASIVITKGYETAELPVVE